MIDSHRKLIVWQRAIQMTVAVYRLTFEFPREEMYGLTAQLRRAGVSIASNIAEGYGRASTGEYRHFLGIARGSNLELQTQLTVATEIGFGKPEEIHKVDELSVEVGKMLVSLMKKL
jgi:four helix bundle protein